MTFEVNRANGINQQQQTISTNNSVRMEEEAPSIFMGAKSQPAETAEEETAVKDEAPAETGEMTRKEAKAWIKAYRKEHPGTSKKEARAAFEAEFGYKMPSSKFVQGLRTGLLFGNAVGALISLIGGKERSENFIEHGRFRKDENV